METQSRPFQFTTTPMQGAERLSTVCKVLFDVRLLELRREHEALKQKSDVEDKIEKLTKKIQDQLKEAGMTKLKTLRPDIFASAIYAKKVAITREKIDNLERQAEELSKKDKSGGFTRKLEKLFLKLAENAPIGNAVKSHGSH